MTTNSLIGWVVFAGVCALAIIARWTFHKPRSSSKRFYNVNTDSLRMSGGLSSSHEQINRVFDPNTIPSEETIASSRPVHPGIVLRDDYLLLRNIDVGTFAALTKVSKGYMVRVLRGGMPVNPTLAVRIEAVTGYSAALLTKMQRDYDASQAAAPAMASAPTNLLL